METKNVKFNGQNVTLKSYDGDEFWANIKNDIVYDWCKKREQPIKKSSKFLYTLYQRTNGTMYIQITKDVKPYGKIEIA